MKVFLTKFAKSRRLYSRWIIYRPEAGDPIRGI